MDRIKKYLGLSYSDLVKVFQDKFAILLLTEINKQLKKSSASGGGGPTAAVSASAAGADEETKTIESKSTVSKKASRKRVDSS